MAAAEAPALKIAFPPDGARIDLGLDEGARDVKLALKALGGAPPFDVVRQRRSRSAKPSCGGNRPGGRTAPASPACQSIDAKGESDAVMVRLE